MVYKLTMLCSFYEVLVIRWSRTYLGVEVIVGVDCGNLQPTWTWSPASYYEDDVSLYPLIGPTNRTLNEDSRLTGILAYCNFIRHLPSG